MEETKRKRFWNWTKDNADYITTGVVVVGTIAVAAWLGKQAAKELAQNEQLLMAAINRGDTILPNRDGSYWIIPKAG